MAEDVPVDVVTEILLRLSVNTLSKFKCVSKSWYNLISDPQFQRSYHERSKQNLHYFFASSKVDEENGSSNFHLTSMDIHDERVHDLFTVQKGWSSMLMPTRMNLICFVTFENAYIYNPATRELVTLPDASPSICRYSTAYGFGYVSSTMEYKVVRLFYRRLGCRRWENGDCDIGCEIFTFNGNGNDIGNGWRVIEERCPYPVNFVSAFVNGALHWLVHHQCSILVDDNKHILSFDLENEKFSIVPHPQDCLNMKKNAVFVVELKEMLCLVDNTRVKDDLIMEIWMLKDYENCIWVKEYRIDLEESGIELINSIFPCYMRNGEIIMNSFGFDSRIHFYNTEKRCFRRMNKPQRGPWFALYWESFVSLGSI